MLYMLGNWKEWDFEKLKIVGIEGTKNWEEFERLSEMICRKFLTVCYHNHKHADCFWHQGWFAFVAIFGLTC